MEPEPEQPAAAPATPTANPLPPLPSPTNALAVVPAVKPLGGYMFKQGPKDNVMKRRWHKRWFFQRNMKLYYYKAKGDEVEKGFIDMELCTNVQTVDTAYVIEIVTPRRSFSLKCASDASYRYWCKGLSACLEKAKRTREMTPTVGSTFGADDDIPDELVEDVPSQVAAVSKSEKRLSGRGSFGTIRKLLISSVSRDSVKDVDFVISRAECSASDDEVVSSDEFGPSVTRNATGEAGAGPGNLLEIEPSKRSSLRLSGDVSGARPLPPIPGSSSNGTPLAPQTPEDARTNIAKEIQSTEDYFIHCLEELVDKYKGPMVKSGLVQADMLAVLFFRLEEILEINRSMKEKLDACIDSWDNDTSLMSAVFEDFIPLLKLYGTYGKNYDDAMATLQRLQKNNPPFIELLESCDNSTDLKPRIADLLIAPVQRIPRYRLLFLDLLKKTPDEHPDAEGIQAVLEGLENVANELNDEIKLGNNNRRFLSMKGRGARSLLAGDRDLLKEGQLFLESKKIKYKLYMFTDILVHLTEPKSRVKANLSKPEFQWPLHLVWIKPPTNLNFAHLKYGFGFQLLGPGKVFVLRCQEKADRDSWLADLEQAIDADIQARSYPGVDMKSLSAMGSTRYGNYRYPKGGEYMGWWCDGLRHGTGSFEFFGSQYDGEWDRDLKSGQGVLTFANGAEYRGSWLDDLPSGEGVFTTIDGDVYDGNFRYGKFEGKGSFTYRDGSQYVGNWQFSQPHGEGEFVSSKGDKYVGAWHNGMQHGEGVLTTDTLVYTGYWRFGLKEGKGKEEKNGTTYDGYWKAGQKCGQGTLVTEEGTYDGNWEKDLRHGKGQQVYKSGAKYVGDWDRGLYDGKGKLVSQSDFVVEYEGEWSKGQKHGKGVALFRDGTRYDGAWKVGQMHGTGLHAESGTGMQVDGKWREGRLEGSASVMISSGSTYSGQFKNGVLKSSSKGRPGLLVPETPVISLPTW